MVVLLAKDLDRDIAFLSSETRIATGRFMTREREDMHCMCVLLSPFL